LFQILCLFGVWGCVSGLLRIPLDKSNFDYAQKIFTRILDSPLPPDYLPIQNVQDTVYNIDITIGDSPQIYSLQIDTGSAWCWVTSPNHIGDTFTNVHFNCSSSPTCNYTNILMPLQYGIGNVNGSVVYDNLNFGNGYIAKAQPFLLVTSNSELKGNHADGLCGLGFSGLTVTDSTEAYPTFLDTLKHQNVISCRTFSLYLSNSANELDTNSEIIIGGWDSRYMLTQSFITLNVVDPYYWAVGLEGIIIGSTTFVFGNMEALIDSGTSLIMIPPNHWSHIIQTFQTIDQSCTGSGDSSLSYMICNCGSIEALNKYPNFTFILGDESGLGSFNLTPQQYMRRNSTGTGFCLFLMGSRYDIDDMWILGDVFMMSYYTFFDEENMTIGFAPANPKQDLTTQSFGNINSPMGSFSPKGLSHIQLPLF